MPVNNSPECTRLRALLRQLQQQLAQSSKHLRDLVNQHAPQSEIDEWQRTVDMLQENIQATEEQMRENGCNLAPPPPPPPPLPKISTPWAVLLCKFSDDASEPFPRSFYENLFTAFGAGTLNMVDFFADMSHGQLDLSGSQVFGWLTLPHKHAEYKDRNTLLGWITQAAADAGITLANFYGWVASFNVPTDLFGVLGGRAAVCDLNSVQPSLLGQEMGHGYGLDHARVDGSEADYQDPYDIMSTANAYETPNAAYTNVGPGLNAATMASQGWLDESRVFKSGGDFDETFPLRPLHRHSLPGYLAARIGPYLVEYRAREFWDDNNQFPVVLVHRFQNNHSYVMLSTGGQKGLTVGSVFQSNTPLSRIRVEAVQIDDANKTAYVRLQYTSLLRRIPHLGGKHLIGGVASDGGGYVVIGGRVVPIPPRSPALALLERAVALHEPEAVERPEVGEQVQELVRQQRSQTDESGRGPFRQPAPEGQAST